jgi:hypothetical protein
MVTKNILKEIATWFLLLFLLGISSILAILVFNIFRAVKKLVAS